METQRRKRELSRYFEAREQRYLRGYRRAQVTAGEFQHSACIAAIAAFRLERWGDGRTPRWRLPALLRAIRAAFEPAGPSRCFSPV